MRLARLVAGLLAIALTLAAASPSLAWPIRDVTPSLELRSDYSSLANPRGIWIDLEDRLYVANYSANSISLFAPGWSSSSRPLKVLKGAGTGLVRPRAITVDADGVLYVVNADSVTAYAKDWGDGSTKPIKTLRGSGTGLLDPQAVAFDSIGQMYVVNSYETSGGTGSITVYPPDWTGGNTSPTRVLSGVLTGLGSPRSIAFDEEGRMVILNANSVTIYPVGWLSGDSRPMVTLTHQQLGLLSPRAISIDDLGFLYSTNDASVGSSLPSIAVHAPLSMGILEPIARIAGTSTRLSRAWGISIDGSGQPAVANDGRNSVTKYRVTSQLVSLSGPSAPVLADREIVVIAKSTSGLGTTLASTTPKVCSGAGKDWAVLKLLDVGTCTVVATQEGNQTWLPAPRALLNVEVAPSPQQIDVAPIRDVSLAMRARVVTASTTSRLPVIWRSQTTEVCRATRAFGQRIVLKAPGICRLTAEQPGNRHWAPASPVSVQFSITR